MNSNDKDENGLYLWWYCDSKNYIDYPIFLKSYKYFKDCKKGIQPG